MTGEWQGKPGVLCWSCLKEMTLAALDRLEQYYPVGHRSPVKAVA